MNSIFQSTIFGFLQGIGTTELMIILLVVLLLFGPKKLPELARGMGRSIREFKKATSEIEEDIKTAIETEEKPVVAQTPAKPVTPAQAQTPAEPQTPAEAVASSPQQTPAESVTSVPTETPDEPSRDEGNSISPPPASTESNT